MGTKYPQAEFVKNFTSSLGLPDNSAILIIFVGVKASVKILKIHFFINFGKIIKNSVSGFALCGC
jgi:hypothetical protein